MEETVIDKCIELMVNALNGDNRKHFLEMSRNMKEKCISDAITDGIIIIGADGPAIPQLQLPHES